ncbi:MAG: ECF-type sigma factor [Planctomycetota bacterium]
MNSEPLSGAEGSRAAPGAQRESIEALLPAAYEQLRGLARRRIACEAPGHTLDATALVHEAYLRLIKDSRVAFADRTSFIINASLAMRRILIEHARRRHGPKRGGGWQRLPIEDLALETSGNIAPESLEIESALRELAAIDELKCAIVTLRYLLDFNLEETAELLDISPAKVKQDWTFTRAWLRVRLNGCDDESGGAES